MRRKGLGEGDALLRKPRHEGRLEGRAGWICIGLFHTAKIRLLSHVWSLPCYSFSWGRSYLPEVPSYDGLFYAFVVGVVRTVLVGGLTYIDRCADLYGCVYRAI